MALFLLQQRRDNVMNEVDDEPFTLSLEENPLKAGAVSPQLDGGTKSVRYLSQYVSTSSKGIAIVRKQIENVCRAMTEMNSSERGPSGEKKALLAREELLEHGALQLGEAARRGAHPHATRR